MAAASTKSLLRVASSFLGRQSARSMMSRSFVLPTSTAVFSSSSPVSQLWRPTAVATSKHSFSAAAAQAADAKKAMFCYQCEQTEHGTGCTVVGVCSKTPETAALQDLLVYQLKRLSLYSTRARQAGVPEDNKLNVFVMNALFATMTNVNFDPSRFQEYIAQTIKYRDERKAAYEKAVKAQGKKPEDLSKVQFGDINVDTNNTKSMVELSRDKLGVDSRRAQLGDTVAGVQELIAYGLKGLCAYASHAERLGKTSQNVFNNVQDSLNYLAGGGEATSLETLLAHVDKTGATNLEVMQLLDEGHDEKMGTPSPAKISFKAKKGKAILISGHDMVDLKQLLEQTKGTGINVYTHGEMLPAHGYPELRKYEHLAGNYGGAWQLQKFDFSKFPGPIIMTTNCLMEPRQSYRERVWTVGEVGFKDVKHLNTHDFTPVIKQALELPGFTKDEVIGTKEGQVENYMTGFGHKTVLSVADKVLGAVNKGELKRIVLIGGCDGAEGERSYYTKLATKLPKEAMILTLGCGKYRFNKQEFGTLGTSGLPRMLDMGQCNDAFSAIKVAGALAGVLKVGLNDLPLSLALSWFEQKAVAVLLTLLHLNIKGIRVGPALPAFVTPDVWKLLQTKWDIKAVDAVAPESDVAKIMVGK